MYPAVPSLYTNRTDELSFLENTHAAFNYVSSAIGTAGVRVPTRKPLHCLVPYMYTSQLLLIRAARAMYETALRVPSIIAANDGAAAGGGGSVATPTSAITSAINQACTAAATEPTMEVKPGTGHWLRAILDYGVPWGGLLWGNFEPETDARAWKNSFNLPANTIGCLTHQTVVVMTHDARTLTSLIAAATNSAADASRSTFWIDGIDWDGRDSARDIKLVLLFPSTVGGQPIVTLKEAKVLWENSHRQSGPESPLNLVVNSKNITYAQVPISIFEFDVLIPIPLAPNESFPFCRECSVTVHISIGQTPVTHSHTFVWKTLGHAPQDFNRFSGQAEMNLPYIKPHMVGIDASMRTWLSGDIWLFGDAVIEDARKHAKRDFGGDNFGINRVATLLAWKAATVIARPFSRREGYFEARLDTTVARDAIDPVSRTTWDSLFVQEDLVNEAMKRLGTVSTQTTIRNAQERIKTLASLMDSAGWPFGLSLIHTSLYGAFEPLPHAPRVPSGDENDPVFLAYTKLVAAVESPAPPQPHGLVDFASYDLTPLDIAVILLLNGNDAAIGKTDAQKDELKLFVQRLQQTLIVGSDTARVLISSRIQPMGLEPAAVWPRRALVAGEKRCDGLIARIDVHLLFTVYEEPAEEDDTKLISFWVAGAMAADSFRAHVRASIEKGGGLNPDSVPQVFRMLLQSALFQASSTEANFMVLGVSTPSHAAALVLVSRILTSPAYSNAFEWKANFNDSTNCWEIKNKVAVVVQFAYLFLIPRVAPPAGTERERVRALRDRLSDAISRADAWYSGKARAADDPSAAAGHWQQLASNIFWSPPATAIPPHAAGPTGNGAVHWLASGWSQAAGHHPRTQSKNGITLHIRNLSVLGLWIGILALVLKIDEQGEFVESTFAELPIIREYSTSATPKEKRAALRRLAKDALLHVGSTPTGAAAAAAAGEDSEATARVFNIMPAWGYGQ